MAAKKNEQHPLRIEGYGSAGEGWPGWRDRRSLCKGALAGEICQVQLLKVGKSAAWGRVTQVLTPVPGRQSPDCPPVSPVWRMSAAAHDLCRGTAL